jgi:hypothetical protein
MHRHPCDLASDCEPRAPGQEAGDLVFDDPDEALVAPDCARTLGPAGLQPEVVRQRADDRVAGTGVAS